MTYNSSDESELSTEAGKGPAVGAKLSVAKSSERIGRFSVSKNENADDTAESNGKVQVYIFDDLTSCAWHSKSLLSSPSSCLPANN